MLAEVRRSDAARRSLLAFIQRMHPRYQVGWIHELICERLEAFSRAVSRGERPRMLLTMPPRHGKSTIGEHLVAWHLGHHPWHEVVVAGYALTPAEDRTRNAREIVLDPDYRAIFPALTLSRDSTAKTSWKTTARGACYAAGVGGSLTSKGAHLLLIDDPHKDWDECQSPRQREQKWTWYQAVARTRLAPGAGVIIIHTRWHEDDLTGRVLEHASHEGWEVLHFPAIATEDEHHPETGALLRRAGEALHPERYDLTELEVIKRGLSRLIWLALYQGAPTSVEGTVWQEHWFRRWTLGPPTPDQTAQGWVQRPERFDYMIVSADFSGGSQSPTASWGVIQVWGRKGQSLYLIRERRARWRYHEGRAALIEEIERTSPRVAYVEAKSAGEGISQELEARYRCVKAVIPKGSKVARAHAAAPRLEAGQVYIPATPAWPGVVDWIEEACGFPGAANDDRVDAAGQVIRAELNRAQRRVSVSVLGGRR